MVRMVEEVFISTDYQSQSDKEFQIIIFLTDLLTIALLNSLLMIGVFKDE